MGAGTKPEGATENKEEHKSSDGSEEPPKRCICARCLQMIDEGNKLEIGGQTFHSQCAKCYFCHAVPTSNLKIYYGQVFCEECFNRHVLNRNKDNPSDFFKHCFEQWQNNAQFADNMRDFMAGNKDAAPFVFMMQGPQPPFCRCGTGPQEWFQSNEPKKSTRPVSVASASIGGDSLTTWDLSFENRTDASEPDPSAICESANVKMDLGAIYESSSIRMSANEKIEKLTKYLHGNEKKKWKNFKSDYGMDKRPKLECPSCLWQCGSIYVSRDLQRVCEVSIQ
ncbi:uncharacterized protein LOC115456241 isoform X1 [Manduca sexta]|uniref:uncharacterized protein LOC115456241 isoform X1 n=1 Tax=Manduca sexta TaxID=7130 RepID=UPI00188F6B03|nr:uncharacterized protein LOC115456241 isoform X1 [Manduca sexta]